MTRPVVRRVLGGASRSTQVIACSRCASEDVNPHRGGRASDHTLSAAFARRGWLVSTRGKHICPACRAHPRIPKDRPQEAPVAKPENVVRLQERSEAASEKIPDLYLHIADAYDRKAKRYRAGVSDETIATALGLSPAFVAKRREMDFGPLVVHTTRSDLAQALDELKRDMGALLTARQALVEAMGAIAGRLDHLETAIAAACERLPS